MPKVLILKQFDSEVKTIEGERALNVTITTNDVDRSGDIVEPKGAKLANFKKNPVVLMAHDYQGLPIGKASNLTKTDNGIIAKVIFPEEGTYPLADTVYNLYKQKFMRAWSIGFVPIKSEDIVDDEEDKDSKTVSRGKRFKTWELLEFSACAVPANPHALTNMVSKGIDVELLKEEGFIEIEEKAKYNCECIKCGYKMTSDKHCKDIKCPKCGGTMRRVERPGPGEESVDGDNVINKPEETEKYIRIPVAKCDITATIDIDKKQGITALYCGKVKKIATYIFEKAKGWTLKKAQKWVEDHKKEYENIREEELENLEIEIETEEKSVIPFKETPKAPEDEEWDAGKEVRQAEISDLKIICTWFDSENPDVKGAYKLPHHKASGHAVVWRAVAAAMAALLGARGGVAIPAGDKKGVYNHLVKHYKQFDKEPPDFRDYEEAELKELFPEDEEKIKKVKLGTFDIFKEIFKITKENEELKEKLKAIELKSGAVLNAKNKSNLKKAQELIQSVLDSAETTEEDLQVIDDNKNDKKDDNVIDIVTDTVDNIVIDKEKDEAAEEAKFQAKIESIINQSMDENRKYFQDKLDYELGRVKK